MAITPTVTDNALQGLAQAGQNYQTEVQAAIANLQAAIQREGMAQQEQQANADREAQLQAQEMQLQGYDKLNESRERIAADQLASQERMANAANEVTMKMAQRREELDYNIAKMSLEAKNLDVGERKKHNEALKALYEERRGINKQFAKVNASLAKAQGRTDLQFGQVEQGSQFVEEFRQARDLGSLTGERALGEAIALMWSGGEVPERLGKGLVEGMAEEAQGTFFGSGVPQKVAAFGAGVAKTIASPFTDTLALASHNDPSYVVSSVATELAEIMVNTAGDVTNRREALTAATNFLYTLNGVADSTDPEVVKKMVGESVQSLLDLGMSPTFIDGFVQGLSQSAEGGSDEGAIMTAMAAAGMDPEKVAGNEHRQQLKETFKGAMRRMGGFHAVFKAGSQGLVPDVEELETVMTASNVELLRSIGPEEYINYLSQMSETSSEWVISRLQEVVNDGDLQGALGEEKEAAAAAAAVLLELEDISERIKLMEEMGPEEVEFPLERLDEIYR